MYVSVARFGDRRNCPNPSLQEAPASIRACTLIMDVDLTGLSPANGAEENLGNPAAMSIICEGWTPRHLGLGWSWVTVCGRSSCSCKRQRSYSETATSASGFPSRRPEREWLQKCVCSLGCCRASGVRRASCVMQRRRAEIRASGARSLKSPTDNPVGQYEYGSYVNSHLLWLLLSG